MAAATMVGPSSTAVRPPGAGNPTPPQAPAVMPSPFVHGAHEHNEPFIDVTTQLDANAHALGPFNVPAYGYFDAVVLLVEATGGVNGAATVATVADAPWTVLQQIQLVDVNGAPLYGPVIDAYRLYLTNKYGAYQWANDPVLSPSFSAVSVGAQGTGNFSFLLRIPVRIVGRDALGALPNQNAASTYKPSFTIAPSTSIYSTPPDTTLPAVRVRGWLEAWSQPLPTTTTGGPQATTPPALGTTQYWSYIAGTPSNPYQLTRVGALIREWIVITRDTNGARVDGLPDPVQIQWDSRILLNEGVLLRRQYMYDRFGYGGGQSAQDVGVYVYDFIHDLTGRAGAELRELYLPTTIATRMEIAGVWRNATTNVEVLTNDVAPTADIAVGV